jgi:5-methylcytosine-specific restriction protein A
MSRSITCEQTKRRQGRAGVALRQRRLDAEPLCRRCADGGRVVAATVPDHIMPLAHGGTDDDTNIRCLCEPCHKAVTAEQFGTARTKGLGGCDASGVPTNPDHPWHRVT